MTLLRPTGNEDIVVVADAATTVGDVADVIARSAPDTTTPPVGTGTVEVFSSVIEAPGEVLARGSSLAGAAIANGAAVRVVASPDRRRPDVGWLRVTSPGASARTIPLAPGSITIGRDSTCDIVIDDPLVSKRHARLEIGADRVELIDLNSANGILVGGSPVTRLEAQNRRLDAVIGDTEIAVQVDQSAQPITVGAVHQHEFIRSPRVEQRYLGVELEGTDLPRPARRAPFPWLALVAPLVLGVVLFLFTQQPMTLLFVALSPVLMIGTWVTARGQRRQEAAEQRTRFDAQLGRLLERLETERGVEEEVRRAEFPSLEEISAAAVNLGPLVWTRRPEHWSSFHVELGRGDSPSRSTVAESANRDAAIPDQLARLDAAVAEYAVVRDVPILESLPQAGSLGVAGSRERSAGYVRALLAQLTGLHAPADMVVVVIAGATWSTELADAKWLPHVWEAEEVLSTAAIAGDPVAAVKVIAQLEELAMTRRDTRDGGELGALGEDDAAMLAGTKVGESSGRRSAPPVAPRIVVVIAPDAPVELGRLIQLSEHAAGTGILPVWIAPSVTGLPAVCRTSVELAETEATARFVRLGTTVAPLRIAELPAGEFGVFARALARLTDAGRVEGVASDLPQSVSLVHLLGRDLAIAADSVVDRWRQNESLPSTVPRRRARRAASRLRALIGAGPDGALHLDLRSQGPHALVGGTTGSGKSEFLQAWVLGMAAEYSPARVTFLFVDYKGGSAFADCIRLPHCVGLVTDLSPHLVRRVLTSLRAEIHRRERLFERKKVKDILEFERSGDPLVPPALVLVIDEFAALAKEIPEFVDGVVDVAQRGRSLGIHLIMATQRPAGVIKENLRANTNLRIALRMADEADSDDVIGVKDAAMFDPSLPGRGIAKTGPGRTVRFQTAYVGGWSLTASDAPRVQISTLRGGEHIAWEQAEPVDSPAFDADPGPTDQQLLVARMVEAAELAHVDAVRRPWLDELAPTFDQTKLQQRTDAELVLGVVDLPESQEQVPFYFEPDVDGHIAFFGTGGSGKSTALRTLAISAGITPRGGPVRVYGVDFSAGGLRLIEPLSQVGSVVNGDDGERVARLFAMLRDELDRRGDAYAAVSASSIVEYRTLAAQPDEARILLLIDGFANFRQEYETAAGRVESYRTLQQVLSDGRGLGIHVALTADRAQTVPSSLNAMIQRRVVLRMADSDAYGLLDAPRDILDPRSVPGRAIIDRHEAQIAVIGGSRSTKEQSIAIGRMASALRRRGQQDAPPIRALPTSFVTGELPDSSGGRVVIGVSDVDLGPHAIEPSGLFLLAGPPGSGRTNALLAIAAQVHRALPELPLFYLGRSRSAVMAGGPWTDAAAAAAGPALIRRVVEAMDADRRPVLIIEGIGEYATSAMELTLSEVVRRASRGEGLVIAEGELSEWTSNFGLIGEVKAGRRGVVLQPDGVDGDIILRTPMPRFSRAEFPVGRGVLVERGRVSRLQFPVIDAIPVHDG